MNIKNIEHPYGISVFGSAITSVEPDTVVLNFEVASIETQPRDAFTEVHVGAGEVRKFLAPLANVEFGSARINLERTTRYNNGEDRFVGYTARIVFRAVLRDLAQLETLITGVVNAGATAIKGVDFQSSRLTELRSEARRKAVAAAKVKAENYCAAAGVKLGRLLHIEDVNPDVLRERSSHGWTTQPEIDDEDRSSFSPGAIVVGGAVQLAFEIES